MLREICSLDEEGGVRDGRRRPHDTLALTGIDRDIRFCREALRHGAGVRIDLVQPAVRSARIDKSIADSALSPDIARRLVLPDARAIRSAQGEERAVL